MFQQMITVLIADDHPTTIQGVRFILEKVPDMKIVGVIQDGAQIKQAVERVRPNVLLLDLKMPNHSPATLERWVRENYPDTVTLIFTAHDRDAYLSNMMETGVAGYLDKKLRAGQLVSAIRRAARGEILFEPEQIERARRWKEDVKAKWESLSERERKVLQMLTEGADNKLLIFEKCMSHLLNHLRRVPSKQACSRFCDVRVRAIALKTLVCNSLPL